MTQPQASLDPAVAQAVLGYLNFSDGRPDARWQRQLNDGFGQLAIAGSATAWTQLLTDLGGRLQELHAGGSAAFRDISQAEAALRLASEVLVAYRTHHADLLAHVEEKTLYGPFFLARVFETILQLRQAEEKPPEVSVVLGRLNDFVGHRPIAILETRPQGEPYEHERHRPLPLFLRGAGVAYGRYQEVIGRALDILRDTDRGLLQDACFNLEQLEEMALDLRAYDHGHPVNRRPNYVFGEWDPHHIDQKGRYDRYVIRKITLDALMERVENTAGIDPGERLTEGAAVLAGTILMAAGVSGWGPGAHDSTTTLAALLPRIARYRDLFYEQLIQRIGGKHAERLRQERETTRQPFGAARQHLNGYLARHRAMQMQQRYLALLFAEMGYPRASDAEARRIMAVSVRLLSAILCQLSVGQVECEHGQLAKAAARLPQIEDLLHRGIACGALADPWNILGYQGLFPLSSAREDSLRDPRLDELTQVMEQTFTLHARIMSEAAAAGDSGLIQRVGDNMDRLAQWWDRYATYEVSDLRRVHGGEASDSARYVAKTLAAWRERGEMTSDLAFWRDRLEDFRTPRAFALVVEAMLLRGDHRASMGLLGNWAGQAGLLPLEEGTHSFHHLALRWMLTLTRSGKEGAQDLVRKFFEILEANAEYYWGAPKLEQYVHPEEESDEEENPFEAAYEDVTYRDSTDDTEGMVADGEPTDHFDLEEQHERLEDHLRFLATLARLWQMAARFLAGQSEALAPWLEGARKNRLALLNLLDVLHAFPLPDPSGDHDSLVEYDRRRVIKEQLIYTTIATSLDTSLAVGALRGALGTDNQIEPDAPGWEPDLIQLERALFAGDVGMARSALPGFIEHFRGEPLLFTPLAEGPEGGDPRAILRVRIAQAVLQTLLANLPRLGMIRETYDLLRLARSMEQSQPTRGRGVTEFNHFFQSAYQAVVENVARSAHEWPAESASDEQLVDILERLTAHFLALWIEHSKTLQLSVLEGVQGETEWRALVGFVQRYGGELFHARFMTLGNLRGILHRGVNNYLDYLQENVDPLHPSRLIDDLGESLRREEAVRRLEVVLQAVIENYEEYKDYNTTTTQSDYGENLHVLLDFLRLKSQYERHAWQFRPLVLAHEMLARHGRPTTALRWEESLVHFTRELARKHLEQLTRLERQHGVRLGTISDRLHERFVKPLALDRLCALIEPSLAEARRIEQEEERPAFRRLQEELRTYTTNPTGVGLDVPAWLRRLEAEVHRVQANRSENTRLAENFFRVQRLSVSHDEVQRQLREWERPALPS